MNFASQGSLNSEDVYQGSTSTYFMVASVAVLVWDVLDNIVGDYKLLFRSRLALSTVVYFASRLGTLGYAIASIIFYTAPTGNCVHFETLNDVFYPISLGCSTLLFVFRLYALYSRNLIIVRGFFLLWLALIACTSLMPIGIIGGTIGTTKYCEDAYVPGISVVMSILAPWVHDTLVFIAISWRLFRNAHSEAGIKEGIRIAVFGKSLPAFSKGLLLDSQRYYLIVFVSNLVVVVMLFDPSISISLRGVWVTSNVIVTNIMACRIYRKTKAALFREPDSPTTNTTDKIDRPLVVVFPSGNTAVDITPSEIHDSVGKTSSPNRSE